MYHSTSLMRSALDSTTWIQGIIWSVYITDESNVNKRTNSQGFGSIVKRHNSCIHK